MLDANILSDLIRNPQGKAARRSPRSAKRRFVPVSSSRRSYARAAPSTGLTGFANRSADLLDEINVLPFEAPADDAYSAIRSALETAGTPIGSNDLLIAAHAQSLGATIVTATTLKFERVQGLHVENWLGSPRAARR
jgi:tRNA(fMet)-specific endonuclease VapC